MKKLLFLSILSLFLVAQPVNAQYVVTTPPPKIQKLFLNKWVFNPVNNSFVDNLSISDTHFLAGQIVTFKVEVKNTGDNTLQNVAVKDKLPDFVEFNSGPGTFDASTKTLNFNIDRLEPGESKAYEIKVRIKPENLLPQNQSTCITNFAEARANDLMSQDTAVFCIESKILAPVQELPKTGPAQTSAVFLGSIAFLSLAFFLYKRGIRAKIS